MNDLDWVDCVRWCHEDQSLDSAHIAIGQLIDFVQRSTYQSPILTARIRSNEIEAAGYLTMYPGALGGIIRTRVTTAMHPKGLKEERIQALGDVILSLCKQAIAHGAEIVQAITPIEIEPVQAERCEPIAIPVHPFATEQESALATALAPVTILVKMECSLQSVGTAHKQDQSENSLLTFLPHTKLGKHEWEKLVEATYVDSQDVPELNGLRSIHQTLVGYASACADEPDTWWAIELGGQIIGCLLITPMGMSQIELTYLGLLPSQRGNKLARRIMSFLNEWARSHAIHTIQLAVDRRNTPAIRTYLRFGFEPKAFVRVWIYSEQSEFPARSIA